MRTILMNSLNAASTVITALESGVDQKPCTAQACGRQYDLNPLSASSDYIFESHSGRNFTLNVCRSVVSDPWNPRVDSPQDIGGFVRAAHGDFSIGQANTTLVVQDMHPVLYMMGGSSCPQAEGMKASTAIQFICDTSVDEGQPKLLAQLPPADDDACMFFIEWRTKYACPVPNRYAYWKTALMAIVILLALLLTLISLLALHKLLKRRRAQDPLHNYNTPPIPNIGVGGPHTWPAALAERARDVKRLLTGQDPWGHPNGTPNGINGNGVNGRGGSGRSWRPTFSWGRRSRRNNNFSRLPRSAEEEAMMGGNRNGPFSVDDEDEDDYEEGGEHRAMNGSAAVNGNGGDFNEESAAWGAARPHGMDSGGVIRL
ncbi:mannose 6-phosphate receptor domain-containing protein [Fomitiporia mediterranea MF3/22]|uniref:mannose 6-phosphate receptor domain-containing protein n=1 Tax=Fomitiporia mediterranea (strain MF3/22) TaxID=694068 RepID=UPI0004408311|nr:mannose 6-phosphate receptor domain-containing protein [Fomitiporia mediterranea MF3/22]EJC98619.1 mannose 6-phosphate receptor domain-containing protein [Fomitiporia mediterranea MF3/22]